MDFTEQEVKDKLEELGYHDVPHSKLLEFMADLEELIQLDLSGCVSSVNDENASIFDDTCSTREYSKDFEDTLLQDITTKVQPKAFAKEKIKQSLHHISFDKENMSVFDSIGYSENLSSTMTSVDDLAVCKNKNDADKQANLCMKRKVARKKDGSSRIFDESTTNNESELLDITALEERVRTLPVRDDDTSSVSSYAITSGYRKHRSKSVSSLNSLSSTSLPAFIRPSIIHPHTKNLRKCDPVSRYHQFKKEWKHSKFPGESSHSNIRWNVREQMLHCEVFEKPRHQHNANDYVVPTEKKRQSLRWRVRTAMARQ